MPHKRRNNAVYTAEWREKMSKKVKLMIYVACTLWIVVFAQIVITKIFVSRSNVAQAFARNQLVIEEGSGGIRDICRQGGWVRGKISGKLSKEEKRKIADNIFGYEGGSRLSEYTEDGYYVAYGFTSGISLMKRVNGKTINMNIVITYDENEDKSVVYFGVPIFNGDF